MKVVFSNRARREAARIDEFWRANRPAAPDAFWQELAYVASLLETSGVKLGRLYTIRSGVPIRRVLMEKTEHHVYIRHDEPELVTVVSVWSARRGRGPRL